MMLLLLLTGLLEVLTGVALLALPSEVARILLGAPLGDATSCAVARVAGAALLSIGMCCLVSRGSDLRAARPLILSLVIYNCVVIFVLLRVFSIDHMRGIGLWPAAILHAALAVWCIACLTTGKPARVQNP